ncbi:MAG: ATP-grasp domain-containing protein [bacterium]|nr:ATP-grasp domain-containing protein [bacterium]
MTDVAAFRRIVVVNRGEPAVRLMRAVAELRHEGHAELRTIALYTEPDKHARFVREADEAYALGSATFVDPEDGHRKSRYLDYGALETALRKTRAEAAWVGWGFVAEHARFADLCSELGIVFIGPDADVMRTLGDKIGSKRMAEQAGVPVAPWSGGPVESLDEARMQATALGFPLMVKATAGGGGRGIRRVRGVAELEEAFESARNEALSGFGDATVFMERLVEGARHIEVQILGDGHGTTWALGVRDCTVQRRNQKVIEESPSPALSEAQHREIRESAARLGTLAGYRGAGTVEFLYDQAERAFSFMEVNARLQVEHPVTEATTGVDLVKLQLYVAAGGRLEGEPPAPHGHAIEVRINAEDPERGFTPTPGTVELLRLPTGPGLRIDTGFSEGDDIAPEFDSMLAKVIAYGHDRREALARLRCALEDMQLVVRGGTSNKGFLLGLLERPEVESGEVDVGWLDRLTAEGEHLSDRYADVALVMGAIEGYEAQRAAEQTLFYSIAARGRLRLRRDVGVDVELRRGGVEYALRVLRVGPDAYQVEFDDRRISVEVQRLGGFERRLLVAGQHFHVLSMSDGHDQLVEVNGVPHRLSRDEVGTVRSTAPAVVVSVAVAPGDRVEKGDRIAVLEAMKTEIAIAAPCAGRVREVLVGPNVQVGTGEALVSIEPSDSETTEVPRDRVSLEDLVAEEGGLDTPAARSRHALKGLRRFALGFDVDAAELARFATERREACLDLPPDDPELLEGEREILAIFADQCALLLRQRGEAGLAGGDVRTPEEYLLLYLRSLDSAAAGLSPGYVDRLQRALHRYGIDSLDRTPALEETLLWICKGHQRIDELSRVVLDVLERQLTPGALAQSAGDEFRELLDRIVNVAGGRNQAVADLAREVRYRLFDRPFFESIREGAFVEADELLRAAVDSRDAAARAEAMRELVECSQPLAPLFVARIEDAEPELRRVILEVLFLRYYRIRELRDLRAIDRAGRSFAFAEYSYEGREIHAVTGHGSWKEVADLGPAFGELLASAPADHDVVIDLHLRRDSAFPDPDEDSAQLAQALAGWKLSRPVRRIVITIAPSQGGRGMAAMRHFTFRPDTDGVAEDRLYRGLHPMMGKRLQLWRLGNFEVERIPSAEDVYLFHGVARDNPKDERLFAFAEVRDATPVRDASGRVTHLPHLEMQYMEALGAIRLFQSHRTRRRRLHWNRVLLYVWPPLDLEMDELQGVAHRLLPAAEGLGLQKTVVRARMTDPENGGLRDTVVQLAAPGGSDLVLSFKPPAERPIAPLSPYDQRVVRMRQRGMLYPYALLEMIAPPRDGTRTEFPPGEFREYDLDAKGRLIPVDRAPGGNQAKILVGTIRNETPKHPEGMTRVILLGDASRDMGSFAEAECRRIMAAIDLAEELSVPLEWFPISAGARIAMDSGTENLDWTAAALRRIVEFTQAGGELNLIVTGINVGGQSYWNAEATMLMHTKGILIMTPDASMVLTGKRALDYSGGVSAEDNTGIGGYEKIMGVNGEAQYWARDTADACRLLFRHYEHSYRAPGERFPRRAPTNDPIDRDVCIYPYGAGEEGTFEVVGDIWSAEHNAERRRPFDIRRVMHAVIDQDHEPLERWADMREAEGAVVWDAHLGGIPASVIGIESRSIPRLGFIPADGPEQWTGGTLFPLSSKKVARAICAASGNRPVVVLANLSGFDGSPESLRRLQLEYGAEIGRAVVNFEGPMVFCVISRYHGGAYVVFSSALNEGLEVAALEGSRASVIGGAPAAAVVFSGEVERRTRDDTRLQALEQEVAAADEATRGQLRARWHELYDDLRSEKLGEVADEFDRIHSVDRARTVGSLHEILQPSRLRPYLVEALQRGMAREIE